MRLFKKRELLFVGNILALGFIQWNLIGIASIIILNVLISHELNHYLIAKDYDTTTQLPVLLSLGFINLGLLRTKKMSPQIKSIISFMGPINGIITSTILILISGLLASKIIFVTAMLLLMSETYTLLLGSDAKRIFI